MRTLTGHKANIKSIDFHPYGEFIASGSLDTTVRVRYLYSGSLDIQQVPYMLIFKLSVL